MEINEYYLKRPQEQLFWRVIAFLLKPFAIGDQVWWGYPKQSPLITFCKYFSRIYGTCCLILQIGYLYKYHGRYTFFEQGNIFSMILANTAIDVSFVVAVRSSYEEVLTDFMKEIHIYYYEPKTEYRDMTITKTERYTRLVTYGLVGCVMIDCLLWMGMPVWKMLIYDSFHTDETTNLEVPVNVLLPFDYTENLTACIIINIVESLASVIGCSIYAVCFSMLYTILFHVVGRINILKNNLKTNFVNIKQMSERDVSNVLGLCVRDHVNIIRYFGQLQNAYGFQITGNYVINLIFDSLLLVEIMYGDKITIMAYFLLFVLYVGNLILSSSILEFVYAESESLANDAYELPWEEMSVPNRRILLVMLQQMQQPLRFEGFGGLQAGYKPAISIMKSTFSYYVMLKSRGMEGHK